MNWIGKTKRMRELRKKQQNWLDENVNYKRSPKDKIRIDLDNELEHMVAMLIIGTLLAGLFVGLSLCSTEEKIDYDAIYSAPMELLK